MKPIVRVWPDHGSTGFYCSGGRVISPPSCLLASTVIAVRYWHAAWEYVLTPGCNDQYLGQWFDDGELLVADMNACQSDIQFVYCVTLQNSHYDRCSYLSRRLPPL